MKREVDRRRALAQPREHAGTAVRIPRGRLGHGAARLRSRRARAVARERAVAARRRDRDHALPPRPLGRPRAVGVGLDVPRGARRRTTPRGAVGAARRSRAARGLRHAARLPRHVRARLRRPRVHAGSPVLRGGARGRLEAHALRVADGAKTIAYSGDSGPSAALVECARDADLFVCEATLLRGELDGEPRGHLALDEALEAFEAAGAKRLLVTHRPAELPSDGGLEFAYDGLELAV